MIIVISTAALVPTAAGLYGQLVLGEPWGNEPMNDTEIIILFVAVLLSICVPVFLLLAIKYEIRIDTSGIHWRFVPNKNSWQHIPPEEIENVAFVPKTFLKSPSHGYHNNLLKRRRSMIITGKTFMQVRRSNGETYLFGTAQADAMKRAMKKMNGHLVIG